MEEFTFEGDAQHLAEASRRFPAQRLAPVVPLPAGDISYLAADTDFATHAWDEGGRP